MAQDELPSNNGEISPELLAELEGIADATDVADAAALLAEVGLSTIADVSSASTVASLPHPLPGSTEYEHQSNCSKCGLEVLVRYPEAGKGVRVEDGLPAVCGLCSAVMCAADASILDPQFCKHCMPLAQTAIREEPLIGPDDVKHAGRHMFPVGENFYTTSQIIAKMDDVQLKSYIDRYKLLVRQAEVTLDYRRITLNAATLEQEERALENARKLRSQRLASPLSRRVTANVDDAGQKIKRTAPATKMSENAVVETLKAMGDPQKILDMLKALQTAQAAAKKK